jgi:hypothetical protein
MSTRKVRGLPTRRVRPISRQAVFNPARGLNNFGAPNLIDNREWADLQNIQFDESGIVRKRMGYEQYSASLTNARGLGSLNTVTLDQVLTVDNGTFKYTTGTSWTSNTSVTFTANKETNFTQARESVYIWNGTEGGSKWDGTNLTRPGTMPRASFSVWYKGYQVASGVDTQPHRVYFSRVSDESIFTNAASTLNNSTEVPGATVFSGTGAQYIDVNVGDGDKVTGLGIFSDILIIFKEFSIYQFTLESTGSTVAEPNLLSITKAAGCISHKSIVPVENDLYFLSREGVRVIGNEANYFNSIRTSLLSQPIQPVIDAMKSSELSQSCGVYYNDEYILTIPDSAGSMNTTIVYNRIFRGWTKWKNTDADSYLKFVDSSNNVLLLFLDVDGTKVQEFTPGVYSDDGQPIDSYILSKVFDFGNPDITKFFVDLGLMFRTISGQIDVEVYTEGNVLFGGSVGLAGNPVVDGMGLTMLGYTVLGEGGGTSGTGEAFADEVRRVVINTNSTSIRFKISNARNNENFVLLGYIHAFYPYGHFLFDSSKKIYL